jgi:glycosyl transferase, family 25
MIPVIVISLQNNPERREFMRRQLENLDVAFRFSDAVDGRVMTSEALTEVAPRGGDDYCGMLTPQEIGCALSHLAVIGEIADDEREYAAVFEDDVFIATAARKFFDEKFLRSLPAFDILQLDGDHPEKLRLTLSVGNAEDYELCALAKCHHSMYALIYTREAARRIAAAISDVTAPIDNMIFYDRRPSGFRILALRPSVVRHNGDLVSAIGYRPPLEGLSNKIERERRRLVNWGRRWLSFGQAWGIRGILSLRLRRGGHSPQPCREELNKLGLYSRHQRFRPP